MSAVRRRFESLNERIVYERFNFARATVKLGQVNRVEVCKHLFTDLCLVCCTNRTSRSSSYLSHTTHISWFYNF